MKAVGQARLELSGVSTPDHLSPPPPRLHTGTMKRSSLHPVMDLAV